MRDRFRLHRRIDIHPLEAARLHRACAHRRIDRRTEQQLHPCGTDAFAPAGQQTRIDRQLMLQVVEAAEELPIGVFDPALNHLLIRQIEGVLEVAEPDHQPRRLAGSADALVIERPERGFEPLPIDQPREPDQLVFGVEQIAEASAEQVVGTLGFRRGWTHRKSPERCLPESGFRHFRIPADAQESLIRQRLGIFFRAD
jgi:hypothetical protein